MPIHTLPIILSMAILKTSSIKELDKMIKCRVMSDNFRTRGNHLSVS